LKENTNNSEFFSSIFHLKINNFFFPAGLTPDNDSVDNNNSEFFHLSYTSFNTPIFFPASPTTDNDDNVKTAHHRDVAGAPLQDPPQTISGTDPISATTINGGPTPDNDSVDNNNSELTSSIIIRFNALIFFFSAGPTTDNDDNVKTAHHRDVAGASHGMVVDGVRSQQADDNSTNSQKSAEMTVDIPMDDAQATRSDDTNNFDVPAAAQPSTAATNDTPAPSWLGKMLVYLRGVSDVTEWQDLVSSLVEFESMDPPSGVSA